MFLAGVLSLFLLLCLVLAANAVLHMRKQLDKVTAMLELHVRESAQQRAQQGFVPHQAQPPYGGQQ